MSAPFPPEQEARIREIAREEAVRVAVVASKVQAGQAAGNVIDRFRIRHDELTASLCEGVRFDV